MIANARAAAAAAAWPERTRDKTPRAVERRLQTQRRLVRLQHRESASAVPVHHGREVLQVHRHGPSGEMEYDRTSSAVDSATRQSLHLWFHHQDSQQLEGAATSACTARGADRMSSAVRAASATPWCSSGGLTRRTKLAGNASSTRPTASSRGALQGSSTPGAIGSEEGVSGNFFAAWPQGLTASPNPFQGFRR